MSNRHALWLDPDFLRRFWAKVAVRTPSECWPWLAGNIRGRGTIRYKGKEILAPRAVKVISDRAWPEPGLQACHSCDNPNCVNPSHIWWGTAGENTRDAAKKKRLHVQRRTHCTRGHELVGDNLWTDRHGHARCRECKILRQRKWWASTHEHATGAAGDAPSLPSHKEGDAP